MEFSAIGLFHVILAYLETIWGHGKYELFECTKLVVTVVSIVSNE